MKILVGNEILYQENMKLFRKEIPRNKREWCWERMSNESIELVIAGSEEVGNFGRGTLIV